MTVPSTTRRAGPFTGTGALTSYPFTFKVFAKEDLAVTVADEDGLESTLVLDSSFLVTLNGDQETTPGGSVQYAVSGVAAALPAGYSLAITGEGLEYEQTADLPQGGNFNPVVIENALDRQMMLAQLLRDTSTRTLRLSVTSSDDVNATLPTPVANNIIGWDSAAQGLRNVDPLTLVTVAAFASWQSQTFNGTGAQTQFTLSSDPGSVGNLDVAVGGVTQRAGIDFTLSGVVLTFTNAPYSGTNNVYARWGQALPEGTSTLATQLASEASADNGALRVGGLKQGKVNVAWYPGDDATGVGDSTTSFNNAKATGHANYIPTGTRKLNVTYSNKIRLEGDGSFATLLRANDTATAIMTYTAGSPFWTYHSALEGIGFYGTAQTGIGFTFSRTDPAGYAAGDEYVNNVRFVGSYWDNLDKAVQAPFGNIGSEFYSCGISTCKYGIYSLDNKYSGSPGGTLMHAGNKYFYAGEMNTNTCAVYLHNTTDGFGGIAFRDTIFEQNQVAVYSYSTSLYTPITFDNVWLEANGFLHDGTANVTLDTYVGTTKSTASFVNHALIFDGTKGVYNYNGGFFTDCHVLGTNIQVTSRGSRVEQETGVNGRPCVVDNADCAIYIVDPSTDQSLPVGRRVIVKGIVNQMRNYEIDGSASNASAKAWFGPHRSALRPMRGSLGLSRRMQTVETSLAGSTYAVTGTVVEDGVLFPTCNEWSIPFTATTDFVAINGGNIALTAGWWVATWAVKVVSVGGSGVLPKLSFTRSDGTVIFANLVPIPSLGEWHTLVVMGKATTTLAGIQPRIYGGGNGTAVVRMQALQCVRFDTKHEAQLFAESGAFSDISRGGGVVRVTGAAYTVLEGDEFITANRAGTVTLTLPAALDAPGRSIHVRTITANTVVSASSNVEPLAGGALGTAILSATAGRWARLVSDGAQWMIQEGVV